MNKAIFESIIAQQAKLLNRATDVVTKKGIGKFGIQPKQLLELGIIKPGILDFKNMSIDEINQALNDPAIFTGKDNINSLDDILNNEKLQSDIVQQGMERANEVLKQSGILTGKESVLDTAIILGTSMVATGEEIVTVVKNNGKSKEKNNREKENKIISEMLTTAKASQFATSLAEGPAKYILNGVRSPERSPKASLNSVDTSLIDTFTNVLIGNTKVASVKTLGSDFINNLNDYDKNTLKGDRNIIKSLTINKNIKT